MTNSIDSDDAAIERLAATPTPDWRTVLADLAIDTAEWQPAPQADEKGRARS